MNLAYEFAIICGKEIEIQPQYGREVYIGDRRYSILISSNICDDSYTYVNPSDMSAALLSSRGLGKRV
jgi:hypothetical protein